AEFLEGSFNCIQFVVVEYDGVLGEFGGYACRGWVAECQQARACLDQQDIGVAVVAAFERDDLRASGCGASQADGCHGGFGAGADESYFLDGRQACGNRFGDFDFSFGGGAEGQAVNGGFLYGANDFRVCVAKDGGAPGTDVVDVFDVVGVPYVGAL